MSASTPDSSTTGELPVPLDDNASFFENILTPGSSLHPTFLILVDGAFAALFCVFIGLLFITGGNLHILVLIVIEGCLYASVKWFIRELKEIYAQKASAAVKEKEE